MEEIKDLIKKEAYEKYKKLLQEFECKAIDMIEDLTYQFKETLAEELDDFFANYKVSESLTEDRIKEIAVNEQRKVFQSMVKGIVEKECNQLYTECNTWKRACELACKRITEVEWLSCPETDDISESENEIKILTKQSLNYFYQQAKKEKQINI